MSMSGAAGAAAGGWTMAGGHSSCDSVIATVSTKVTMFSFMKWPDVLMASIPGMCLSIKPFWAKLPLIYLPLKGIQGHGVHSKVF